ncbi:MAG: glycosyltransferase [Gaiellaceae bacterium]
MRDETTPTVAVLTDLWPSITEPYAGSFVREQVGVLGGRYRHVLLVPRLVFPGAHARIWGGSVPGRQRGWLRPGPPELVLRYPMARLPKLGEAELRGLGARLALARAGERPDLVHGHFLHEVGVAAVRLGRALKVPVVLTAHGTDARWLLDGGIQERHRRSMLAAVRAADRLVVVERGLGERIAACAGLREEQIVVQSMGVDEAVFRPRRRLDARHELGLSEERRLVLFIGRGELEKGIDLLDAALLGLDADCVALGPPGEAERIRWVGVEPPERVALWLAAADVFCLPSRAEGMPVSVMEALACGRPVVAAAVGGIPEQVEEGVTGLLVPSGDASALAGALLAAFERDWDEQAIRASSERFWWRSLAPRLTRIYEELL